MIPVHLANKATLHACSLNSVEGRQVQIASVNILGFLAGHGCSVSH
jgi:hypothetical protein